MVDRLISISGREYDREIIKYGLIAMGNGVLSVLIILMCGVIEKRVFEMVSNYDFNEAKDEIYSVVCNAIEKQLFGK